MEKNINRIKEIIEKGRLILFIGSGLSVPLNLPSWGELISFMGESLGYDKDVYNLYGDYLSRAEYYKIQKKGVLTELSDWMLKNWIVSDDSIRMSETHQLLPKINANIVYTTNYDHCLEQTYRIAGKNVRPIIDISDMYDVGADAVKVIKFHGDMSCPKSMVLTESDYFRRMEFEDPLDIQLRAHMLTHSFLFLGYSMSDPNLRMIIYRLNCMWDDGEAGNRPESFIFMAKPNRVQEEIFKSRGLTPVVGESPKATKSTVSFLKKLIAPSSA